MTPTRRSFVDTALVFSAALAAFTGAMAETHTVSFVNNCGYGTPTLIQGPNTLSTGAPYTSNGPLDSAIAYLQTGSCLFNGEGCLLAELTLGNPNPSIPGSGSSADISMIAPHKFSVPTSFEYTNGCDGVGAVCNDPSCQMAFRNPNDNQVQVACQADNVNLVITFCGNGAAPASSAPAPAATTNKPAKTSPAPPANTPAPPANTPAPPANTPAPPANNPAPPPPANTHAPPPPANTPAPSAPANVAPSAPQSPKTSPTSPARQPACHAKKRRHTKRSGTV